MPAYVVDTGVFLRWFVEQVGFEHAREVRADFLTGAVHLETTDSVGIEYAHVLRTKGLLVGLVEASDYPHLVRLLNDLGVVVHSTDVDAVESAARLSIDRNLRFFDAVIADRALRAGLPLLTTDKKLAHALAGLVPTRLLRGI